MKKVSSLLLVILFVLLLYYGGLSYQMSLDALTIWFEKLVPSMFCIMVLVNVLFDQNILTKIAAIVGILFSWLLQIERMSFAYVIACMFLGFPAGANFINEQVCIGNLSKEEGQRLICTCSFATPGFVIMTCGALLFESITIGIQLFIIQVASGFVLLLATRRHKISGKVKCNVVTPLMLSLRNAMLQSGKTLYIIGGYLLLFMSAASILAQFLPANLQLFFRVISEFSSGSLLLGNQSFSQPLIFIYVSMLLSFGGLCVHMQVMSMSSDTSLSYARYVSFRLIQVCLSALLAYIIFQ